MALTVSRRQMMRHAVAVATGVIPWGLAACTQRLIPVTQVVEIEREVTKIVTSVVRETVIVEETLLVERTVEKIVTASLAPTPPAVIVADLLDYSWTQFVMLMSPAFQEMFPQTVIEWRSLTTWERYPQRVAIQQAAGNQADLLEAPLGALLHRWLHLGVTQPLDEQVKAVGIDTDDILGGVLSACRAKEGLAGWPLIGHGGDNILFYNRTLFERAGIAAPSADWTVENALQAARALAVQPNDGGAQVYGLGLRCDLPSAYPALRTFEGALLGAGGREAAADGVGTQEYLGWVDQALAGEPPAAPRPWQLVRGPRAMFLEGNLGMIRDALGMAVLLARLGRDDLSIGSTLYPPRAAGGQRGALPTGVAYAVSAQSAVAREAVQWMRLVSSHEMSVQMLLGGYAEPGCRMSAWKDPRVLQRFPVAAVVADSVDRAEPEELPWNYRMAECLDIWNQTTRLLQAGHLDPMTCAGRIHSQVEAVLAKPEPALDEGLS